MLLPMGLFLINVCIRINYIEYYMSLPFIIAVSGKQGSGKDYITDLIIKRIKSTGISVSKMAFADQVKVNVATYNKDISIEQCLIGEKSSLIRKKLQQEGTEKGRDVHGNDLWVNMMENWMKLRYIRDKSPDVVIVTDCRFKNEAAWIEKNNGLLIRVISPLRTHMRICKEAQGDLTLYSNIATHRSETDLDDYQFIYTINNDPEYKNDLVYNLNQIINDYISKHINYCHLFGI